MLAGIGGAALPLVLHLLARARYRTVDWGAMMFLTGADVRQQQRARLKQILLLLVRMAIVGLLAVALARPIVYGRWGALAAEARTTAVIIFDRSASMGLDEGGKTRLDQARESALQVLSHLKGGDQVSLVLVGDEGRTFDPRPTSDLQSVARMLADVKPSFGRAGLADALAQAATTFQQHPHDNHELFVITDRQEASWEGIHEGFAQAFAARSARADRPALRFVVVPVGSTSAENLSIEAIELLSPPAVRDQPTELEIRVRNHGRSPQAAVPLVLTRGKTDRTLLDTTVNLAPQSVQSIRASVRFEQAGPQVITAALKTGGPAFDNALDAVVDVLEPLDVLIVSGDERPGRWSSESDFLKLALAPFNAAGRKGPDLAKVTIIEPAKLATNDLRKFDVLILANVPQLGPADVRAIEQYVYDGGGALIAPGGLSRVENYNQLLHRDGVGALPASLSPATSIDGAQATGLLGLDLSHPVLEFLRAMPDPIPSATIGRYFPASVRSSQARVLGSYVSGEPFLVESRTGRGRVLLVTTPLDADWSTLPLTSFYLPFVQSAVRYLAGAGMEERNVELGSDLTLTVDEPIELARSVVQLPDGRRVPVQGSRVGTRTELVFSEAAVPGTYTFRLRTKDKDLQIPFIVRRDAAESDLTPIDDQRLLTLSEQMRFDIVDPAQRPLAAVLAEARSHHELWPMLLLAVVGLAVVELLVTRFFS
jgi:hypothetical protein